MRRTEEQAYHNHCIRRRWKHFKEFMFLGCFQYESKGICCIWEEETLAEKKEAKEWMDKVNIELEAQCKLKWELSIVMRRMNVTQNMSRKKPK